MTQVLEKKDRYLSEFQAFEAGLSADEPGWVRKTRRQALERFAELGFPTARRGNEKWKYTSVAPIANSTFEYPFHPSELQATDIRRVAPWDDTWASLVFIDGRYSEALSAGPAQGNGARVTNLAEAVRADGDLVERHLGQHATFEDDAFTALNTAFLNDGAFVHVLEGDSTPSTLHLVFASSDREGPTVSYPRTLVVAGPHSVVNILESYVGVSDNPNFTNAVTEIVVGEGAAVEHSRLLSEGIDSFHVGSTRVYQGRDSTYSSKSFARGAALARNDLTVLLDGQGGTCNLKGLYTTEDNQHVDNYINVDHAKPHTTSRLYYKGILDGSSKAVFGGTVLVRPDAQKADSQQTDKNLLLSEEAEVNSKPSLLIYADDVKCSHGATAGHMDEDAVHYMRSRGLDQKTAGRLLIYGFAREIIDTVQLDELRTYLDWLFLKELLHLQSGRTA